MEFKGKNIEDAVKMAVKFFKTTEDNIKYKVIEESNKTLFSILSPRYAIIDADIVDKEKTIKTESKVIKKESKVEKKENNVKELTENEKKDITECIDRFLNDFAIALGIKIEHTIEINQYNIVIVKLNGDEASILIGYKGEILESLQVILRLIASNMTKRFIKIQLDIVDYREKRKEKLEDFAKRIALNVVKSEKSVTLEPMIAYERKIIHTVLQENDRVETKSIGEEPYRRVIVSLKK